MRISSRLFSGYLCLGMGIANVSNAGDGFFPAVVGFLFLIVGAMNLARREY